MLRGHAVVTCSDVSYLSPFWGLMLDLVTRQKSPTPDQIRALRASVGWSQDRASKELAVTTRTWTRWESENGVAMPWAVWYAFQKLVEAEMAGHEP